MLDETKIMNLSTFFEKDISPTILGAFFRRSDYIDNTYVFAYFRFNKSKYCEFDSKYYQDYADCINANSGDYPFWQVNNSDENDPIYISSKYNGVFVLKNDLGIVLDDRNSGNNFTNRLINKLRREPFWSDSSLVEQRNDFIRGYFDVALSYDGSGLLAGDYYINNPQDIKKISALLDGSLINPEYYNFNTRLTEDTRQKKDQFRVSWKYYLKEIGSFCKYRMECIHASDIKANSLNIEEKKTGIYTFDVDYVKYKEAERIKKANQFIEKYYTFDQMAHSYRIEGKMNAADIELYRKCFGFGATDEERKKNRNKKITDQVYEEEPDECVCCKGKYNISDRTFLRKYKLHGLVISKYYFEIHHVISYANEKDSESNVLDVIENLVKVCPTCHTCMTKKRGLEKEIKDELIANILKNSDKAREFAEGYFGTTDVNELIDKIYDHLK